MPEVAMMSSEQSLLRADRSSYLHPFTSILDQQTNRGLMVDHADGVTIWDSHGRRLLDAAAGLWCVNVGYGREEISRAIFNQSKKLAFFHSFNSTSNEPSVVLSERLLTYAPSSMRRVFFGCSGSDANDSAVKLVWYYNNCRGMREKRKFIARQYGYHGVSVAAGSLTGIPLVHRDFGLPLDFVRHVSRPDLYRDAESRGAASERDYSMLLAKELEDVIVEEGPDTVAAFVAEPIMGTGGVFPPPEGYFEEIKKVLDRHDILLIADEVITGFGRVGRWFASDAYGFIPDLTLTAKGLTSGYLPLSALLVGDKVWDVIEHVSKDARIFAHGFTYSGHPVCTAASLANLDIIERESLVDRVRALAPLFHDCIFARLSHSPIVGDIRGDGLMAGIELVAHRETKAAFDPQAKVAARVATTARDLGLLVRALPNSDVIALSPPFITSEEQIADMIAKLGCAIDHTAERLYGEGLVKS